MGQLFVKVLGSHERGVRLNGFFTYSWVREVGRNVEPALIYQHHSLLVEPFNALPPFPKTVLNGLFCAVYVGTKAVLLAQVPPALVLAAISPVV